MTSRVDTEEPDVRDRWTEGSDKRQRLEMAREAGWGRLSWLSVLAGVFTAIGLFVVCAGLTAALLRPMGITVDELSDDQWRRLGIIVGVASAVVLLVGHALGGYVAGRMARRAGLRHGMLVFVVGVVVLAAAAAIAQLEGGLAAIRDRVESLGAPTGDAVSTSVGVLVGALALGGMLCGSLLGAVRGERWHQRLVARALDPDIGPEADLRSDVEAQQAAAAKALAKARNAGVVPDDDDASETTFWDDQAGGAPPADWDSGRREREPTAVGRSTTPSSWSSGP
jgi:pimeloyl-ACP methyl ester carboxylesterase